VLLNNITFLWFLLFSMCHSLHVAVNKCINWCFVHLYLLFYYNNKVFMLMVNYKPSALHGHEDTEPEIFWGSRFWSLGVTRRHRHFFLIFWGHATSSVTWPLDSAYVVSFWLSIGTLRLSCTVTEIWGPKDIGVTTLTFWGHVTSSVTWPLDSAHVVSYGWSIRTMRLPCTVTEI